jgi:hypothetical protein
MHAGRCRTFDEILSLCYLSGGISPEPHSKAIGSRQDSVRGLAWDEANFQVSAFVRMLRFRPCSEREMIAAGLQSHSRHVRWVQCID